MDLSTGLNPRAWQVPPIPASVWTRLPENEDGLLTAASDYYGTRSLLAVAGSQAAIQSLPFLRQHSRVLLVTPSYAEHQYAWSARGHRVEQCAPQHIAKRLPAYDVLIVVNPNNPSAHQFSVSQLLEWRQQLADKGGWLVVDEAFIDAQPENSLLPYAPQQGLVVLRSIGKFFGLAGLRLGFVCAPVTLLQRLDDFLGPWAVNGAARWIAKQALQDRDWQQHTRIFLQQQSQRLRQLLSQYGLKPSAGCELFQWIQHPRAVAIHRFFAQRGLLTRLFLQPLSIRFGLPGAQAEWTRLEAVLSQLSSAKPAQDAANSNGAMSHQRHDLAEGGCQR